MRKILGNKKNIILFSIMGVIILIIIILIINNMTKQTKLPVVNVISTTTKDAQEKVEASGVVVSQKKKTFFSPVNAQINTLNLKVGDSVSAGTDLIAFDLTSLEEQNKEAKMEALSSYYTSQDSLTKSNITAKDKAQAEKDVKTLNAQVNEKKNEIKNLQNQMTVSVNQAAAAASEEMMNQLNALNTQLAEAQAVKQDRQKAYNEAVIEESVAKTKMQQESNDVNTNNFKKAADKAAETANLLSEATAAVDSIQAQINNASISGGSGAAAGGFEMQVANAQTELAELQGKLASAQAIVDSADISILSPSAISQLDVSNNIAELKAKSIEELIEEGKKGIHAEFTGVITKAEAVEGATVTQGMELFTLESTEDVNVNVMISKYDLEKIKVGQSAEIIIVGNEYKGKLVRINKIATTNENGTTTVDAEVHIDNPDQNIFLGVEAKAAILGKKAENVLMVPAEVINNGMDGSFCYVVKDGTIVMKKVETGISSDNYVEVKSGLEKGDLVITDSVDTFEEGQKVDYMMPE